MYRLNQGKPRSDFVFIITRTAIIISVKGKNHRTTKSVRLDIVGLAADALFVFVRQPFFFGRHIGRTGRCVESGLDEIVVSLEPADIRICNESFINMSIKRYDIEEHILEYFCVSYR